MSRKLLILIAWCCSAALFAQQPPLETAWSLLAEGERAQAVAILRDLLRTRPQDADVRLLLGSILTEDGERNEALAQLSEAVRLRPQSAEAHHALGEACSTFGDAKMARGEFERAIAIDPRFAPARVSLAQILVQNREFAGAVQHLDRALQLLGTSPDAAYPHYLRAKINAAQNEMRQAAVQLDAAVTLRPDFAEAWSDLGQARKALMDDAGALTAFQKAVESDPGDAVARYRLGAEYLHQKQSHLAVPHLQKAVDLNPKDQSALYALQIALRQDGQIEAARQAKEKLTDLLRRRDEAAEKALTGVQLNNQGVELEKAGKLPEALEKYRAALTLNPDHVGFRVNHAAALLHLGKWNEGIAELRESLRRDPGNSTVQAALDKALAQAPK